MDFGVEEVKKLCRKGELPCKMTDGGHYKIEVYDDVVSRKEHEAVLQELAKYKTIVNTFLSATEVAGILNERK